VALHLIKLAVGIDDLEHLRRIQKLRRRERGRFCFFTRNHPRRAAEILDGGSIYWVIKGWVLARQRIIAIDAAVDAEGRPCCAIGYDPTVVPVEWQPRRAFQGWRYLPPADAPPDRRKGAARDDELPPEMARALRDLGLI
jgi:hypothetical protein